MATSHPEPFDSSQPIDTVGSTASGSSSQGLVPVIRRALLLRHGATDWNLSGRWQGRTDVPLNAQGVRQAEEAARALVRDTDITRIVHSTAKRAAQTAAVISGGFTLVGRPLPLSSSDQLVEIDVGEWSGLTHDEVAERYPDLTDALGRGEDVRRGMTGETLAEAGERVRVVFDEVMSQAGAGTVLFVMHGAVIRALTTNVVGLPESAAFHALAQVGNCCWVELGWDEAHGWRIHRWNAAAI